MICDECKQEFRYKSSYYDKDKRSEVKQYKCGCPTIQLETVKYFSRDELAPWERVN
ncbi:hypothetical protein [Niallia sp. FSL R7-0271]|uniref:hypothetical protein n=1 Tax=unclassified Niallia TaxID=2837522 RepID=UPI0030F7D9D6